MNLQSYLHPHQHDINQSNDSRFAADGDSGMASCIEDISQRLQSLIAPSYMNGEPKLTYQTLDWSTVSMQNLTLCHTSNVED